MNHARAILWVQFRTLRHLVPRAGVAWTALIGAIWYGGWICAAGVTAWGIAQPTSVAVTRLILPGVLLLAFLYWQLVPLMMASTGASLDLRKLKVYPIPTGQFFLLEVLLRTTAALEMLLVMAGVAAGIVLNPQLRLAGVAAMGLFTAFNLLLATGIRDIVGRMLARRRVREIGFFLLLVAMTLPQFFMRRLRPDNPPSRGMRGFLGATTWSIWPWSAASNAMHGERVWLSLATLLAWGVAAGCFARWQFARTLAFDADAARSAGAATRPAISGMLEWIYRIPSHLFRDPLGALIEKELRFLSRAPRFRMLMVLGFTLGLLVWLPVMLGRSGELRTTVGSYSFTLICIYSILLLGEACFWNSFGFDRSAAQFYFVAPIDFARVLMAKNLSGMFFVTVEITLIATVFVVLRMPLTLVNFAESYAVVAVSSTFLLAGGNLVSVHRARGADPSKSLRRGTAGGLQALLVLVYPATLLPVALAYLARYAFDSSWAFWGVLAANAAMGLVVYHVALESAVEAAARLKEKMTSALAAGDGPITG